MQRSRPTPGIYSFKSPTLAKYPCLQRTRFQRLDLIQYKIVDHKLREARLRGVEHGDMSVTICFFFEPRSQAVGSQRVVYRDPYHLRARL